MGDSLDSCFFNKKHLLPSPHIKEFIDDLLLLTYCSLKLRIEHDTQ